MDEELRDALLEVAHLARTMADAYPEDLFPTPPLEERPINSAAAFVLREVASPQFARIADALDRLTAGD